MTNFLPEKLKKEVKREYLFRLLSFSSLSLLVVIMVAICFLMPSSFLSKTKINFIDKQISDENATLLKSDPSLVSETKKTNEITGVLSSGINNEDQINSILKKIINAKNDDVKISIFSFSIDPSGARKFSVQGTSNTRDSLISFTKDLKSLGIFANVDLPVSDLIKNSNVDFTIGLTLNK
jgi:hypothetical protein